LLLPFAQEHKTYRCKVADVVLWNDGRLQPDSNPESFMRRLYGDITVDTLTGAVTGFGGEQQRELWVVTQRGDQRAIMF
jgi:hypothetical protein